MTVEEKRDFLILKKLLPYKDHQLSREGYNLAVKEITGNSNDFAKQSLLSKGYLQDGHNYVDQSMPRDEKGELMSCYKIFLTDLGVKAYSELKSKKKEELIRTIAFWIILIATAVSAFYSVLTYYASE